MRARQTAWLAAAVDWMCRAERERGASPWLLAAASFSRRRDRERFRPAPPCLRGCIFSSGDKPLPDVHAVPARVAGARVIARPDSNEITRLAERVQRFSAQDGVLLRAWQGNNPHRRASSRWCVLARYVLTPKRGAVKQSIVADFHRVTGGHCK